MDRRLSTSFVGVNNLEFSVTGDLKAFYRISNRLLTVIDAHRAAEQVDDLHIGQM